MPFDRLMSGDPEARARKSAGLKFDELQNLLEGYIRLQPVAENMFGGIGAENSMATQQRTIAQSRQQGMAAKFKALTGRSIDEFYSPPQHSQVIGDPQNMTRDFGTAYAESGGRLANWSLGQPTGNEAFQRLYGAR